MDRLHHGFNHWANKRLRLLRVTVDD